MADKPDNPFKFWEELKRRKVVRVIIGYAAASFIIIEVANNLTDSLHLPDWISKWIVIILGIGLLFAIILSWIFDVSPEGVKKTIPSKDYEQIETDEIPPKRIPRVSDIINAILIVTVIILAYPRIFNKDKFSDIKDEDGRMSVAVMPFQNMTNDTLNNIWQTGLQYLLINNLSRAGDLSVHESQTMFDILESTGNFDIASISPVLAGNLATKLKANNYIYGNIVKSGDRIRIGAQLRNSISRDIIKSFEIEVASEEEFFSLSDSLSNLIMNHLDVKIYEDGVEIVLYTPSSSAEAYKYYIKGTELFWMIEYEQAIESFTKAIELDSNFHLAYIHLSLAYCNLGMKEKGEEVFDLGFDKIKDESMYLKEHLAYKALNAWIEKNPEEMIKYTKLLLEINPNVRYNWFTVGLGYSKLWKIKEAIKAYEQCLIIDEQWDGIWKWNLFYTKLGSAYHVLGKHKKEKELYERASSILPDNFFIMYNQLLCALSRDKYRASKDLLERLTDIYRKRGKSDAEIFYELGLIYYMAGKLETSQEYYLKCLEGDSLNFAAINDLAYIWIDNDIDYLKGLEYAEKALNADPENGSYLDTRGWGLYKTGNYKEALYYLKLASDNIRIYNQSILNHIDQAEQALAKQKSEQ